MERLKIKYIAVSDDCHVLPDSIEPSDGWTVMCRSIDVSKHARFKVGAIYNPSGNYIDKCVYILIADDLDPRSPGAPLVIARLKNQSMESTDDLFKKQVIKTIEEELL